MEEKEKKALPIPVIIAILAVIFVGGFTIFSLANKDVDQGCVIVPQAAFGQAPKQIWTDHESIMTAEVISKFPIEVPKEVPTEYETINYRVYTEQIFEVCYMKDGEEVLKISKGKMCGQPLYEMNQGFPSRVEETVGDTTVVFYGDGEKVSVAEWVSGEFSYFIGAWRAPIEKSVLTEMLYNIK